MINSYTTHKKRGEIAGFGTLLNATKGNPYHDSIGRFTTGPSKAFGRYNHEPDKAGQQYTAYADNLRTDFGTTRASRPQSDEFYSKLEADKYEALARTGSVLAHINDDVKMPLSKDVQSQHATIESALSGIGDAMEQARYIEGRGGATNETRAQSKRIKTQLESVKQRLTSLAKGRGDYADKARAIQAACATLGYLVEEMGHSGQSHILKYSDYYA